MVLAVSDGPVAARRAAREADRVERLAEERVAVAARRAVGPVPETQTPAGQVTMDVKLAATAFFFFFFFFFIK